MEREAALVRLGRLALEEADIGELLQKSAALVAATLEVEFCKVLEYLPDREALLLRAGVGWKEGLVGQALVTATGETHSGCALLSGTPVVVEDFHRETRFQPSLLHVHGVTSGASVAIPGAGPFGVLGVHTSRRREFSSEEVAFLESAAQILAGAINRSRIHEAIRESEERFRRTFEDSPIGMTIVGLDHRFVRANRVFCELMGYSEDEFRQLRFEEVTHPDDRAKTSELAAKLFLGATSRFRLRKRNITKAGVTVWVDLTATLVRDDRGTPLHAVSMITDLTPRLRREEDMQLARFTLDNAHEAIFWVEPDGKLRDANESAGRLLGYNRQELLAKHVSDLDERMSEDDWPRLWATLSKRGRAAIETRVRRKNGESFPAELSAVHLKLNGHEYACGFVRDISARKRSENQLKASEEHWRALIENTQDLITILNPDGTVRYTSPSIERVLGYAPEERVGKNTFELIHPGDAERVREELVRGGQSPNATAKLDFRFRHKDGSWRHLEAVARNLLDNPGVAGIVINSRDITERKRAEEKIRASEEWFRSSFEFAGVPTAITTAGGRFLRVNPAMCRFLGFTEKELLKLSWLEITHPEDVEMSHELRRGLLDGEVLSSGAAKRYIRKDGSIRWGYVVLSLIRGAGGRGDRIAAQISDITERKRAEQALRRSEAELRNSQQELQALAGRLLDNEEEEHRRLARDLHDDFNQRLAAVEFDLSELDIARLPNVPAHLKKKLHSARSSISDLSDDMRRLAYQLHPAAIEILGLPAALQQQCQEASQMGQRSVRFTGRNLPAAFPPDTALCLYRITQECLRNIAKHSRARKVSVTLSGVRHGLRLSIKDNGVGFDEKVVEKKRGLGLISMRERARLVGGSLAVKSAPGQGTQVVAEAPLPSPEKPDPARF